MFWFLLMPKYGMFFTTNKWNYENVYFIPGVLAQIILKLPVLHTEKEIYSELSLLFFTLCNK